MRKIHFVVCTLSEEVVHWWGFASNWGPFWDSTDIIQLLASQLWYILHLMHILLLGYNNWQNVFSWLVQNLQNEPVIRFGFDRRIWCARRSRDQEVVRHGCYVVVDRWIEYCFESKFTWIRLWCGCYDCREVEFEGRRRPLALFLAGICLLTIVYQCYLMSIHFRNKCIANLELYHV